MGDRERQRAGGMQCGQGSPERVCPYTTGRGTSWRKRVLKASLLCLLIFVFALAYAVATGRPIPEIAGQILGILLHALLGG